MACCPHCARLIDVTLIDGAYDQRITELLQANNELLERARTAERALIEARRVAQMAIIVAGEIAKSLPSCQP
jgi:hypothetical protein